MAVLYSLPNKRVKAGTVIDNQPTPLPAGATGIAWSVTVGGLAAPGPENMTALVEWNDGGAWRELCRLVATYSCDFTGRADLRGDGLRFSLTCNQTTTVGATVVSR